MVVLFAPTAKATGPQQGLCRSEDEMSSSTRSATESRMTVEEVAALAGCHPRTVRRAILAGRLKAYRLDSGRGGRATLRLKPSDVDEWLDGDPMEPVPAPFDPAPVAPPDMTGITIRSRGRRTHGV